MPPSAVLITGAAGALGSALTQNLLALGNYEVVVAIVRPGGTALEGHLLAEGAPALETVECDLEDPDGLEQRLRPLVERLEIRALVNNAAALAYNRIDAAAARCTFATNVLAPLELIHILSQQGHLRAVLNISTIASRDPFPGLRVYAASKAALESTVRSLHKEGRIRGRNLVLGCMESPMLREVVGASSDVAALSPVAVADKCARLLLELDHGTQTSDDLEVTSDGESDVVLVPLPECDGAARPPRRQRVATVRRDESFSAAHRCFVRGCTEAQNALRFGKCAHLHGHNYKLRVGVTGPIGPDGFVYDIAALKRLIVTEVIDRFDHRVLNDISPFDTLSPSCENVASVILGGLRAKISQDLQLSIELWETDKNSVFIKG